MREELERRPPARFGRELPRRDFLRLSAIAGGALTVAACGGSIVSTSPPPTPPEFRVGVILPTSGMYANLGDSVRKGMQLFFDGISRHGGGRRIVVFDEDEAAGNMSIPLAGARKLVEQHHVDMIAGIIASPNELAIHNYVDQNRVPTLIANASANALSRSRKSGFIYRTSFSNWQHGQRMGTYLAARGISSLGLVYSDYATGSEIAAAVKEAYGGRIVAEVRPPFPNASGDFKAFITQINGARPEAIYVFLSGADAVAFLRQAKTGLDRSIRVMGSGFLVEQDILHTIGDAAPAGAVTGLHWALTLDNKENRDFTASFSKRFRRTADVFAMQGYDTARVIVEALNQVKGKTDDPVAFMTAISQVSFKSPRGDFKFDANSNNVINPLYVRELVKDPKVGYTNRVISSLPSIADPGR